MTAKRNLLVRLVPCRCLRGEEEVVTALDYSHCSLEQVPKEIFSFEKTLEELYLDANQIEELPKQLFSCQTLHRLSLPDNDLTALPAAIANLINLQELDVSKNSIQEFPENIKNCKVLAIVEASVNPISKLPDGFTQLLSLTQLYLNDAFLEFLPASFGRLTKLQILELRENQLKVLPKSMHKLTQLERLDLGSNEFTEVPEVLPQLTGIRELWLDGNRLTSIPGMIGTMKQLTYLDASKNNLEAVSEQISGCENLQDLLLSSNTLTQLPGSIGCLKKLTTLKVDENQLMYLPDSIGGLTLLDELDCSFNEMEALPPSIGQCVNLRTFAADHNFLTQLPSEIGSWKNVTVLFLHSNKLESLPEQMGDMERLKVINLSDNRLKNLPFSFTKLSQLTAMWLSENQSKPLIPLQKEEDQETHKTVLTNYMFPQQTRTEDYIPVSDNESFNPSLWEEQRRQKAQVAFECDEDKDDREAPPREGNLKRYPTPYPEELKNMVKTAQSIAHRLKEEGPGDEAGKDAKPREEAHVGLQDVGIKVIENTYANGKMVEIDPDAAVSNAQIRNAPEPREPAEIQNAQSNPLKAPNNKGTTASHEHAVTGLKELSSGEEEMKMAEMRPPLSESANHQPRVVTLEKKDNSKDADSLLDETVVNSNQNNSNCSSPSRMSDSVSLTTDSSQDVSLCTPEKEAKIPTVPQCRQEDENQNQLEDTAPLLQNGNGSDTLPRPEIECQREYESSPEKTNRFDLSVEEKLAFIERGMDLKNGLGGPCDQWDRINMNVSELPLDNAALLDDRGKTKETAAQEGFQKGPVLDNNNDKPAPEHLLNGNQAQKQTFPEHVNGHANGKPEVVRTAAVEVTAGGETPLSRNTDELSPQKRGTPAVVVKSQSFNSMETGGVKIYEIDGGAGPYEAGAAERVPDTSTQGQSIVRSKSASLLNDTPLQVYPGSSVSSSELNSGPKAPARCDANAGRVLVPTSAQLPQYNVQYTTTAIPADNLWTQRTPVPPDPIYLPPHHSLANTNYSNRNNAPPYHLQPQQRGLGKPPDMRGKDRFLPPAPTRGAVQRQGSNASTASMASMASMTLQDPRRVQMSEGEYMTYWDLQAMGRGPPLPMGPGAQRPLSARTYSIDGCSVPRPQSARPPAHELPGRTMSVSDFNYQRNSPRKWAGTRVKSEDSLLDSPGSGRVPVDWRDKVLQHIEARKLEKVPYTNGQVCPWARPPMTCGQMPVVRHPSREQLIDYLMQKVSPQHPGPPCLPHELLHKEVRVKIEKNPELGFSISGGGRGNPFRPEDNGIFVTRVQPEGPASKFLQPGDKIIQANGYSFVNIDHGQAVSLLKTFPNTVELIIIREVPA
ncbi:erbin-like [Megalops cyprinoides]|uniref:erbin-like n=1 Tax=Megalops cyprinoides TaxID=118141 RepID=UPI001864BDE2|nr:erbin-like [Megalops cyprinoides]XP_036382355.1 erbin-like [Megalops cyprinoides]XP_036382358.1 erbin-like [Megalops cyprinoides]